MCSRYEKLEEREAITGRDTPADAKASRPRLALTPTAGGLACPIEALNVSILPGAARLDVQGPDPKGLEPFPYRLSCKL